MIVRAAMPFPNGDGTLVPDAPLGGTANHVNRQGLVAIMWVCFAIASGAVGSRLYIRLYDTRRLQTDDIWIVIAWLAMLSMSIVQMLQQDSLWYVLAVIARHFAPKQEHATWQYEQLARWQFPEVKLFWITLWAVKASLLSIFFRVVHPFTTRRRLWYAVATFVGLSFVACVLMSILTCSPPSDYFRAGKCSSPAEIQRQRLSVIISTILDIVTDMVIMYLPLSVLPLLNLDKRRKIGFAAISGLSIFVVCVSIVRMTQAIASERVDLVGLTIWSSVETCVALIVGSLPALRGLLPRGIRRYATNKTRLEMKENDFHPQDSYPLGSRSRTIMVAESIPLDAAHRSAHLDGGIYVQRMFTTHVETEASSADDLSSLAAAKTAGSLNTT